MEVNSVLDPSAAIHAFVVLPPGPLRSALERRLGVWLHPAVIAIGGDIAGRVRYLVGSSTEALVKNISKSQAEAHAELFQETVLCAVNGKKGSFAVVVGALGSVVAIWPQSGGGGKINVTKFNIPTDGSAVTSACIDCLVDDDTGRLEIVHTSLGGKAVLQYITRLTSGPIPGHVEQQVLDVQVFGQHDRSVTRSSFVSILKGRQGESLKTILRAIQTANDRRDSALHRGALYDRATASVNTAVSFALSCYNGASKLSKLRIDCFVRESIKGSQSASSAYPSETSPWNGARAEIVISLNLDADLEMGNEWALQLYVTSHTPRVVRRCRTSTYGNPDDEEARGPSFSRDTSSANGSRTVTKSVQVVRTMICPVGHLSRSKNREFRFPVNLTSHGPVSVSTALIYIHSEEVWSKKYEVPSRVSSGNVKVYAEHGKSCYNFEPLLRIPLGTNEVLDVLDFSVLLSPTSVDSNKTDNNNITLRSNIQERIPPLETSSSGSVVPMLSNDRIAHFFDPRNTQGRSNAFATTTQLELPFRQNHLLNALFKFESFDPSKERSTFSMITALGAVVTFEVIAGGTQRGTTLSIRAMPHVLPFVRAAVLRRIISSDKTMDDLHTCSCKSEEEKIIDAVDAMAKDKRHIDLNLSELDHWVAEVLEKSKLDVCSSGQDRESVMDTVQSLQAAYTKWRLAFCNFGM